MQRYLLIAIGGAFGSMARYWVTSAVNARLGPAFPYGTLAVNMAACLVIGFLITSAVRRTGVHSAWRFLVAVGFIGAFSTFSTFEWETYSNLQTGAFLIATLYVVLSVFLGLIALWFGVLIAKVVS